MPLIMSAPAAVAAPPANQAGHNEQADPTSPVHVWSPDGDGGPLSSRLRRVTRGPDPADVTYDRGGPEGSVGLTMQYIPDRPAKLGRPSRRWLLIPLARTGIPTAVPQAGRRRPMLPSPQTAWSDIQSRTAQPAGQPAIYRPEIRPWYAGSEVHA